MARGACLCGAVRYDVAPPYRWFAFCHCSMCRIHHGALFGAGVGVDVARFEWRSSTSAITHYRATSSFERPFCRHCGAKVPALSHVDDVMLVPAGSLEDFDAKPRAHIFAASKSGAHEIADGLRRFDAYPPGVDLPVFPEPTELPPEPFVSAGAGEAEPLSETVAQHGSGGGAVLAARCLCGDVGYALDVAPERLVHCHCSLCRRSRGGPFSTTTFVPADSFRWTRGEESIAAFRMAPPRAYGADFCVRCGSLLPMVSPEAGLALVPAGALPLPAKPLPAVHIFVGSKADWDVIADGWPQFDEMPPDDRMAEFF
jgi:hypothetical protein